MHDDAVAHGRDAAVGVVERCRVLLGADFDPRNRALRVARDRLHLSCHQRGHRAGGIDIDDLDLVAVELAAFDESGPLLELGAARCDPDRLALQILGRLDAQFREHDGGGRIAPVHGRDHDQLHALGDARSDHKAVGEAELAGLAGDQLGRAA